jgi:hypothetical protein
MFVVDQPTVPSATPSVVLVAQENSARQRPHIFGVCEMAKVGDYGTNQADLFPLYRTEDYFRITTSVQNIKIDEAAAKITVLQKPKHGYVESPNGDNDWNGSRYLPDEDGYLGNDFFILQVEWNGYKVQLHYFIYITEGAGEHAAMNEDCRGGPLLEDSTDPTSWYRATSLLVGAKDALTGFSDLSGSALGQTTVGQITLDADAAGHGWFIDYTPYLNEEWLPTSSPYEWQAKPVWVGVSLRTPTSNSPRRLMCSVGFLVSKTAIWNSHARRSTAREQLDHGKHSVSEPTAFC